MGMKNPCNEIVLSEARPVMPWVQFSIMQSLRAHAGLPPYSREEADEIMRDLGSSWEESFGLPIDKHEALRTPSGEQP